jgi:hypothetical protein
MEKEEKGLDPIAYMVYGENPQLRASAIERLQALRDDRRASIKTAQDAYRIAEKELLEAVLAWKQAEDSERSERALEVGRLQRSVAKLDTERRNAAYPQRFLQHIPPIFLGKQIQIPVKDRIIPFP